MSGDVIASGEVVILHGRAVARAYQLVSTALRYNKSRGGLAPSPDALEIQSALARVVKNMSTGGRMDDHDAAEIVVSAPDTIDADEAATLLGVTRRSVYRMLAERKISGRRTRRTWFIDRGSVSDYLIDRQE